MEAIVLCGLQGSGKTTLYRDRWLETHVRISMDLLRTRHREAELLELCLRTRQPFVVDNTNPAPADRRRYLEPARSAGFRAIGYLVEVEPALAHGRNAERDAARRVPPPACVAPRGGSSAPRPRRASTSSGTPPPCPAAAGGSSR